MNKAALIYSLKVWLTGTLLALISSWIADAIIPYPHQNYFYEDVLERSIEVITFSLAFAIPFFVCVWFIIRLNWHVSLLKLLLSWISLFLGWLPIMVMVIVSDDLDPLSPDYIKKVFLYLLLNCACIWSYRLKPVDKS